MGMNSPKEENTIEYYDQNAVSWALAHGGDSEVSYWQAEMKRFYELLPGGKVLEIGSGSGKDAFCLMRLGYSYTGTDASSGLLEVARKRNPSAEFIKVDVKMLSFPEQSFDGFWCVATLLHIPKEEIDEALLSIRRQIRIDGIGFISVMAGAGEKIDKETNRLFSYYSAKGFREVLERNGFKVIEESRRKRESNGWWLCYWVRVS